MVQEFHPVVPIRYLQSRTLRKRDMKCLPFCNHPVNEEIAFKALTGNGRMNVAMEDE